MSARAEAQSRVGPYETPDRYALTELRSRGGEGELWLGTVEVGGKELPVAVKAVTSLGGSSIETVSERLRDQAELLRSLDHPNVVKVREAFEGPEIHPEGAADQSTRALYLVMNYVPGDDLATWVERNPERDVLEVTRIVSRLAAALDYLHGGTATGGAAVLHRDVKPGNVIVGEDGGVRLVDFGLAKLASGDSTTIVGTPKFLAPEVIGGAAPTAASDRYGLGAVTYFLFTGTEPQPADQAAGRAKLLAVKGVEDREGFADHVMAMMARDPERRPADVVAWAQGLAVGAVSQRFPTVQLGNGGDGRRRGLLVAALIVVVMLIGGAAAAYAWYQGGTGSAAASDDTGGETAEDTAAGEAEAPVGVPNVEGMTLDEARSELADFGVDVEYEPSDEEPGTVLTQDPRAGTTDVDTVTLTVAEEGLGEVPGVEGMTLDEARSELADFGVDVEYEPSGEEPGTVLAQDPRAGATDVDTVTLTVAEEPREVPNVEGERLSGALSTLEPLGIEVTTEDVLNEEVPDGQVVDQDPAAGEAFAAEMSLTVARQPVITYLADLEPVEGDVDVESANISGNTYTRAVVSRVRSTRFTYTDDFVGYDLARNYRELRLTVGLRDDAPSNASAILEIYGDGRQLFRETVALGDAVPVDLDVTGVLRLELISTHPDEVIGAADVVWGDIRLLGTQDEVPQPVDE